MNLWKNVLLCWLTIFEYLIARSLLRALFLSLSIQSFLCLSRPLKEQLAFRIMGFFIDEKTIFRHQFLVDLLDHLESFLWVVGLVLGSWDLREPTRSCRRLFLGWRRLLSAFHKRLPPIVAHWLALFVIVTTTCLHFSFFKWCKLFIIYSKMPLILTKNCYFSA